MLRMVKILLRYLFSIKVVIETKVMIIMFTCCRTQGIFPCLSPSIRMSDLLY